MSELHGSASCDRSRRYRYRLRREWDASLPAIAFVMLNPSAADATIDDPTIRRCLGFARSWGYGALEVVNLFAWRAHRPSDLRKAADPIGPRNDRTLRVTARAGNDILLAWGNHGAWNDRDQAVLATLRRAGASRLLCLGITGAGQPRHPLYVRAATRPVAFPAGIQAARGPLS